MTLLKKLLQLLTTRHDKPDRFGGDVFTIHKRVGETPLQAIERVREERNIPKSTKMAYAGRLDPMAEGKLLVLTGDACNDISSYWDLDKQYRVSIAIGISSDSHDVLGKLSYGTKPPRAYSHKEIRDLLAQFVGRYSWEYPVISSKPVDGKPLFQWFLEDRLNEITIPRSTGEIYDIQLLNIRTLTPEELKKRTLEKIHALAIVTDESKRLGRDFRRHEVIGSWSTWYKTNAHDVQVIDVLCTASAGTYMRTLAHEVGKKLGTHALALEINRTRIGVYKKIYNYEFWMREY